MLAKRSEKIVKKAKEEAISPLYESVIGIDARLTIYVEKNWQKIKKRPSIMHK